MIFTRYRERQRDRKTKRERKKKNEKKRKGKKDNQIHDQEQSIGMMQVDAHTALTGETDLSVACSHTHNRKWREEIVSLFVPCACMQASERVLCAYTRMCPEDAHRRMILTAFRAGCPCRDESEPKAVALACVAIDVNVYKSIQKASTCPRLFPSS